MWSWYDRRKKKVNRIPVQTYSATTELPLIENTPSGGIPPPLPLGGVAPPPPPPRGIVGIESPKSDTVTEEVFLLKKIEYNTKKSRRLYGSLKQQEETVPPHSVKELRDLQNELFSKLQTGTATP